MICTLWYYENCFDTEGDVLDSTVLVDDNIIDCVANDDQEKMGD